MRLALCIVGAIAFIACSKASEGPSLPADQRAGEVIELVGAARAINPTSDAPRMLAAGAELLAGDTIETEPGGSIRVRLDHNEAVLTIEGGKRVALAKSAAWSAKKASAGALDHVATEETQVAGRHGENLAGDTRGTVRPLNSTTVAPNNDSDPPKPDGYRTRDRPTGGEIAVKKPDPDKQEPRRTKLGAAKDLEPAAATALQAAIAGCASHRDPGPKRTMAVRIEVDHGAVTAVSFAESLPEAYATCVRKALMGVPLGKTHGRISPRLDL
jgi:hypothetical protein